MLISMLVNRDSLNIPPGRLAGLMEANQKQVLESLLNNMDFNTGMCYCAYLVYALHSLKP